MQRFSASDEWEAEVSTVASVGGQVQIGAVHSIGIGFLRRIVLTGVAGANGDSFFTQRFDLNLAPVANAGNQGDNNSVYLWAATGFVDAGQNLPAQSAIDPFGRILSGGAFKINSLSNPFSASMARLSVVNGVRPDVIFRTNF